MLRLGLDALERSPRPLSPAQGEARNLSLAQFTRAAWPVIEPGRPLLWNWHHDCVCEHLEALVFGKLGTRNLIVNVPPGSMKSTLVSVMLPAWLWVRVPTWRGIFASGSGTVATRDSLKCRAIVDSHWYRRTFGITWSLADDQNQKTLFRNTASGFRMATTAGAKITGDRGDGIFVDDPLDASDAYSEAARTSVNEWWDQAFANRLSDAARGTRVLISQRLHVDDLPGHILAREPKDWTHLSLPMEFIEAQRCVTSLPWHDPRTVDGELLDPQRFPPDIVAAEKLRLGSSGYAGQYQQLPFNASGEVFRVGALKLWPAADTLPKMLQVIVSIDSAFKTGEENDYSVAVVLAEFDRGVFILDVLRGRYAYPQLKAVMIELAAKWKPSAVLIEDKASGQSLIQDLQQHSALPIRPVQTDGDKLSRAHTITATWEAGRVFALEGAPFLPALLGELYAFPKAAHDDQVDALVQAVRYFVNYGGRTGYLEFMRREVEKMNERKAREAQGAP
jgi:predicted phage terminase large subunit-like protein